MSSVEPLHALNLDLSQQQKFVRYYRNLPEKPATTIRFFNRTDYYTVHGDDAIFASQQVFNTNIVKYMGEEPKLSYLVLSKNNFEKFVRELLLVKQYRVEVYVKPQSRNSDWNLEYKGSPGDLSQFEEIIFGSDEIVYNNCVLGVKLCAKKLLGICCVNTTENLFFVTEITDNEFFTELEAVLAHVSPRECVVPQGDTVELRNLRKVIDRNGILVTVLKKSDFSSDDIIQDLNRLLYFHDGQKKDASVYPETNFKEAMCSLQAVSRHLHLIENEQSFNQFKISSLDVHQYVRLDNAAINALNVLPKPGVSAHTAAAKNASLLGVLDHCCTAQGHRLLEQWIKQPLKDINLINERLDIVEVLVKDTEVRQTLLQVYLPHMPDLLILGKKLGTKKASLQDCYHIYQAVNNVPGVLHMLRKLENKCVKSVLIDPIGELLADMEKFLAMIEKTLDLDLVDRGEFLIKATFDEDLKELQIQKQDIEEKMQKVLKRAVDELGLEPKKMKLECNDQHGYFFRVTLAEEHALRQNKSFKIIDAVKGGVRFTNDKLEHLNQSYSSIKESYEQQQRSIVLEVLDVAAGYADTLRSLNSALAKVDVFVSLATAAVTASIPYVRPKLHPLGFGMLRLEKVRHPCLEKLVVVIPNFVEFKKDEQVLLIVTGPNMGGKSTYIRSVGCAVLMAHIGSFVPCKNADISIVDCILARVGAEDSELKGLSTFALEMVETSGIIRSATSNSLVMIDELGRGTSTYDGCGIAWAIAEYLAKEVRCFSLFATHFNEITQLAETIPAVCNLHVTAATTEKTITPLYQVRTGPCDRSYGIHCARLAGFPKDVIESAIKHQELLENNEGMKYIKDYEISLKNKVIEEGDVMINEAIEELQNLDADKINDDTINAVLEKLSGKNNLFVKAMLDK